MILADAIERARAVRIEDELTGRGIKLRGTINRSGPCPVCGGVDRFSINVRKQVFNCRGCQRGGDVIALVQHLDGCGFRDANETLAGDAPRKINHARCEQARKRADDDYEKRQAAKASYLWLQRWPISGTPAETYLREARGYRGKLPATLGYLDPRYGHHAAMIAAFAVCDEPESGVVGEPCTVTAAHLTLIKPDGSGKADIKSNKIVVGRPLGRPIALAPPNDLLGLAITEGIEDALSVHAATSLGAWAAGSAPFMPALADAVPDHIEVVNVLVDDDLAGRKHANELVRRLRARGFEVIPKLLRSMGALCAARSRRRMKKTDANDILRKHGADALRAALDNAEDPFAAERSNGAHKPNGSAPRASLGSARMDAIMNTKFAPIAWVVPNVLVEGVTLLAAKPKIGKSWLMLHAAHAVATGGFTLGELHCAEGDVLYCALEDNHRRLKSRMLKMFGQDAKGSPRLEVFCEFPKLAEGGLDQIREWIGSVDHPRLIVIDTLSMVRVSMKRNDTQFQADYDAVKDLRTLAAEHHVAIVLVHHLRKAESDDPFDTVNATLGLTAAVDSILIIKREPSGNFTLHGRGRDLTGLEKAIAFNPHSCTWSILGEAGEVNQSTDRAAIIAALEEAGDEMTLGGITAATGIKGMKLRHLLTRMAKAGEIGKAARGKYRAQDPRP